MAAKTPKDKFAPSRMPNSGVRHALRGAVDDPISSKWQDLAASGLSDKMHQNLLAFAALAAAVLVTRDSRTKNWVFSHQGSKINRRKNVGAQSQIRGPNQD